MRLRRYVFPAVGLAALGGAGYAAYRTQDRWVPYVFPPASAPKGEDHDPDHEERADRVKLSEQAQQNLGLEVDALTPEAYWRTVLIPGAVVDRPGVSDRGVTSKIAGVVTAVRARPGDTVRAGDPLFTVQLASEVLQGVQTDLAKAARELEFAAAKRDRVANLVRQGTQSGAVLIEEENQVKRFTTQVQALRRQLQVFGLTADQVDRAEHGDPVTEVTVAAPARAPAAGPGPPPGPGESPTETRYEVQELRVALGEQVQAGQTLATLADHRRLFVEGRAFKSEAAALAAAAGKGLPVRAVFADEAAGEWPAQGPLTIHHLSNQVDPATRTFAFYLPLDNQATTFERDGETYFVWRYRPGQRARLRVPVEKLGDGVFVLPPGAVVREGADAFLFVQNGDFFERKAVRVLYEDRAEVVVANDGSVGEGAYVVRNRAAAVNRALKARAGEGGHDHHHDHDH